MDSHYTDKYLELELVGEGGFGKVFKAKLKKSQDENTLFASKKITHRNTKEQENIKNEISILAGLTNPFIIKFFEAFYSEKSIVMITEYLDGGELFEKVVESELVESECCHYISQVCRALQYIHCKNIVHLDIKPENIVLTEKGGKDIKIIDFGTALELQPGETVRAMVGTPEFVAPEVVQYEDISSETDIWSLGVLTFILLSGASPFLGDSDDDQLTLSNVTLAKYDFDYEEFDEVSAEAKDFITRLLRRVPGSRMTAEKCLEHNWLEGGSGRSGKINIENIRKFLARRKLQNVGRVLRAINVLKLSAKKSLTD